MKHYVFVFAFVLSACGSKGNDGASGASTCPAGSLDQVRELDREYRVRNTVTPDMRAKGEAYRQKYGNLSCTYEENGKTLTFHATDMYKALGLDETSTGLSACPPDLTADTLALNEEYRTTRRVDRARALAYQARYGNFICAMNTGSEIITADSSEIYRVILP